ncbi:MAG: carboxypeptidase regulatory-like domain-containing protein, partial [Ilumatobacteraceae bacterium]
MRMSLHPDLSEISPGDEVELQITVANDATTEVTPIIDVQGLDADLWALANPIPVIAPGAVGRASLRVRLPDDSPPGDRTVAVTARAPGTDAGASAVTVLRIGTNFSLAVETDPSSVTGRSGGRLNTVVRNLGDEDLDVTMSGRSEGADVEMRPGTFTLPAGKGARLGAVITPLKRSWFSERRHGVVIEARSGSVPSSTTAMFIQRPTVPPLLLRITAVVLALAVWASVSFVLFDRISGDPEVAAPVDTVVDSGDAGPPADVVLAGAATDEDDAGVTPPVVIAGTVEGPRDPSGSSVLVERVSFGDEGTTGGSTGKIAVGTPVAFSSGTVLEKISATTDEGGRFRVGSGLIADAFYRVTVSRAGFDLTSQVVTTGGGNTEIDLAITLVPGRGQMTGRVTDLAGAPLGGAEIVATQGTVTYRTTTASEGEGVGTWQIDGLATPATYLVTIIADGHASQQLTVEVGGGAAVSGVDATMERDRGTIRGAITYRDAGVGAVTVALEGDVSRTTTTLTVGAVAGSFDFPNLPYGTYLLTFSKDGWLTQSREVTVSTGDVAIDVRDLLPSTAIIQGAVSQQVTSGSCSYPDPTAGDAELAVGSCGGVGVSVIGETGTWRTTTATGDGSFRLSGIPAGEYTVEFERYGYLPEFYRVIVGPGDTLTLPDDATYDVEMAAYRGPSNRSLQPLDDSSIALRLVPATPLDAAVVKGVVRDVSAIDQPFDELTDENDQPLFDDWDDGSGCRSDRLEVEVIGQSDVVCQLSSGGGFTLTGVAPGAADVQVTAPGFGSGSVTLQVAAEGETLAGLIPMTPLASLSMNVTGSGDVPVDSAVVFLAPASNSGDVITYSGATEVRECIVARSDDTDIWQEVASAPAESMSREGLCADSDGSGDLTFDRALGSGTFDVILPVNGADPSDLVELAGVVPLDHRQLVRTIEVQVGVNSRLDVGLRRYASVVGTIQSPDADGSGYTNVTELEGLSSFPLMGTGTDSGGNTVARGVQFCEVETGTDTCKEYALDYVRPRVSFGSASGLADGQYRIDRIPPNEGTTQREYLFQVFTDDGDFTKGNGRGGPVEGLAFGEERTLSIVTSPQPSTIALDVVWINGTTRTPVTNANARVTGTAGFRTIDVAPFREVITLTCPGADCTTGGMSEDGFTYAITPTATTTDPLEGLFADLDADGRLVIENVYRTGDLTIEIIADGYSSRSVDVLLPRVRSGTVITDAGVVTDGYDVVLAPSPRTVTGSVQIDPSPTDALYEGLAVTLTPAAGGSTVTTSVSAPIGSSSLGTFSFASVSPGTYNLSVTGDGVTAASTSVTVAPGSGTFDIATTIDVGRELLIDATAYECPIGSVCAGTYSSLAPGNYEVVAGATAELESSSDGTTWTRVAVTTTCSDENAAGCAGVGVARFEGLDPSDGAAYRVTFSATGYLASSPVLIGAPTTAETAVVGPLVSYGTITGVVRAALAEDETPSRLAGAAVSLQSADSTVVATTSTGATGRFTFSNSEEIAAGNYTVNVSFPGYSDGSVAVTVTDRNLSSIGDDELDLLAEKVEITGTVTSAAGDDLPHVLVSTVGSGCTPAIASGSDAALKQTCQWTGADGTYSGIEIAPRTTTLVFREYTTSAANAQQTDRPTVERNVTPSVGAVTLALNVEMGTAIGSVTGIVQLRSYNGAALVPDASVVTVTILDGTDVVTTRTAAANGSFSATDLDTGTYDVRLSATGYQTVTYSGLVIIANGTATVPTQTLFAATRTVQVQVTSSSVALTGLALVLSPPSDLVASSGNGSLAGADPDNDGTYVFEGVAPGDWTLASTNGASLSPRLLDVTGIDVVVDVDTAASGTSIVVPAIEFDTVSGTLNAKAYAGSGATSVPGDARVAIVGAPTVYATPDSGGSWTLRALSGADINVTMTAGGYTSFTTSSAVTVAGQSDVDATLIAKTRDLVVSITSTGPDGATSNLSGVDVSATGPDGTTVTTSSGITDGADGTYTITGAIPGAWSFSTTNGAALTPVHLDASGVSVTVPVDAAATGSAAASAYTGAFLGFDAVSGTVTSRRYAGDSASTYAGAVVTSSDDANVSAVTGPDGTWEIRKPVTTTGIGFSVTASGYTSKSVTDSSADAVLTAKVRDVTMSFTSGGSTLDPGTALTVTATPPSDATGLVAVSTSVNAGGVFTLGGLAPGVWTITTAGGADLTPDHLDITTADSITTTVPVDTASSGAGAASAHSAGSVVTFSEVSGIVNDSTGVAAEGVAVRLGAVDITTTDATGAFTLYSPNAKSRELTFFKESAGSASQTVTAPASLTVALTTVSLSVRVLSSDGTALTGVSLTATDGVDTFSQTTASGTGTAVFVGIGTGTWTVDVADGDGVADGVITIGGIQYLVVGPASGTGTGFGPRALTLTESSGVFDVYITPLDKPITATVRRSTDASISVVDGAVVTATSGSVSVTATSSSGAVSFDLSSDRDWSIDIDFTDTATSPDTVYATRTRTVAAGQADGALGVINIATTTRTVSGAITGPAGRTVTVSATAPGHSASVTTFDIDTTSATIDDVDYTLSGLSADVTWRLDFAVDDGATVTVSRWIGPGSGDVTLDQTVGATAVGSITVAISDLSDAGVRTGPLAVTVTLTEDTAMKSLNADGEVSATVTLVKGVTSGAHTFANLVQPG